MSDWQPMVMESPKPVVLDCYAEWCQPCHKLEPILKAQVKEHEEHGKNTFRPDIDNKALVNHKSVREDIEVDPKML